MADGNHTWEDKHRDLIDKIKKGGPKAAIKHHVKGMLAVEASLQAMVEYYTEQADGNDDSEAAKNADVARHLFFSAKTHHSLADRAISDRLGAPASRSGER